MLLVWILVITGIITIPVGLAMLGNLVAHREWGHAFVGAAFLTLFGVLLYCNGEALLAQLHGYPEPGKTVSSETKTLHEGVGRS